MNDWRLLALALGFVYAMARLERVNRRAMKFGGLLVLALAGYKTVPMLAPMFAPIPERASPRVLDIRDAGLPVSLEENARSGGGVSVIFGSGLGGGGAAGGAEASSFVFGISDADDAGIGDTLISQSFPMRKGDIDTAHVADSIEIKVDGVEVQRYCESRNWAYSDGSAKAAFCQFRADPSTETTGTLCYSGCTIDTSPLTEVPGGWRVKGDTTLASINSGDSTGIRTGRRGYQPVMAFATDGYLEEALSEFVPLATVAEANALTGVVAEAGDTLPVRWNAYSGLHWDHTVHANLGPTEDVRDAAVTDVLITVDGASTFGGSCENWTTSTSNFSLWRKAVGQSSNNDCRGGWTYYDGARQHLQYGAMRDGDAIGVESIRRGFWLAFADLMHYPPHHDGSTFQCGGSSFRRGVTTGHAYAYWLSGDSIYLDAVDCTAGDLTRSANLDGFGEEDNSDGEGRHMAFVIDAVNAAVFVDASARDFSAYLDSLMVWAIHGRGGPTAYHGSGVFALDSATAQCSSSEGATPPQNTIYYPLMVHAMMNATQVAEKTVFTVGAQSTNVGTVIGAVADNVTYRNSTLWSEADNAFRAHRTGNGCADPTTDWTQDGHNIQGLYSIIPYAAHKFDPTAAKLARADTTLWKMTMEVDNTVSFPLYSWSGTGTDHRPFIWLEGSTSLFPALGWRQCAVEGSC